MNKSIVSTAVAGVAACTRFPGCPCRPRLEQGAQARYQRVPRRRHADGVGYQEVGSQRTAGLNKGETCVGCHEEKGTLNFDFKRLAGKELEPKGAPKTMMYPVAVQAAYDEDNLYIRLTFKAPAGGANTGDKDNEVKATVHVRRRQGSSGRAGRLLGGCHTDARTMPGADDKKTKYTKEGAYELMQWKSAKGAKVVDGTVTDERKMEGGTAGVKAEGGKSGDGLHRDFHTQESGRRQSGSIWHRDSRRPCHGRFHHVSLGYTLGIGADGDVKAVKQ